MEENPSELNPIQDAVATMISGVPAPVVKNFIKAIGQICTAAVDVPVAWLEGRSSVIRATSEARTQIIGEVAKLISEQLDVPKSYITKASSKFAAKIINEQLNLDQVALYAAKEIANNKEIKNSQKESEELSDDWLNEFENIARLKSSEEMQLVFGRILSGEVIRPGSFSIKTLKIMSELDNNAAKIFQLFCSRAISLRQDGCNYDVRVVSFNGHAASNSLLEYGLPFDSLNVLHEYGLIISDYNSSFQYSLCIPNEKNEIYATLRMNGRDFTLLPSDREKYDKVVELYGVALTNAGVELFDIIPVKPEGELLKEYPADNYKEAFKAFLKEKGLNLIEITASGK